MTTSYSHMEQILKNGAIAYNAKATFTGTVVTVKDYAGADFTTGTPLLLRAPNLYSTQITTGNFSVDFGTSTWGLPDDDGYHDLYLGFLLSGDTTARLCVAINPQEGSLTTVATATAYNHIKGSAVDTGYIVWFGKLCNVLRAAAAWDTTNSFIQHEMGNQ